MHIYSEHVSIHQIWSKFCNVLSQDICIVKKCLSHLKDTFLTYVEAQKVSYFIQNMTSEWSPQLSEKNQVNVCQAAAASPAAPAGPAASLHGGG